MYVQDADIFDSRFLWFVPIACRTHLCNTSPSIQINDFLSFCIIFLRSALGLAGCFPSFFYFWLLFVTPVIPLLASAAFLFHFK